MTQGSARSAGSLLLGVVFVLFQVCGRVPIICGSFHRPPSHQDLIDEVLHHILKSRIRLELLGGWSTEAAFGQGVWVMDETINNQDVNGHH